MNNLTKGLILVAVILAVGVGLVVWKNTVIGREEKQLNTITKEDMEILLKDAAKTNPMIVKRMQENPELKTQQIENLKQLLAVASQARKEGIAEDKNTKIELDYLRSAIRAINYDREINKDKGPMPPFGFISEDQVNQYWNEGAEAGGISWIWKGSEKRVREAEFNQYLQSKLEVARESGRLPKDKEPTEEEINQLKTEYAKIKIYDQEALNKAKELGEDFNRKVELQIKLQQANLLAQTYSQKVLPEKVKVTEEEVEKYLAAHPELDTSKEKKAKAEEVLQRAKGGEDFAALAKEFSEDPGSKENGGLYENVPKGQMVPEFEQGALALEAGQVAPNLIETKFGYHIIKLERKGETQDQNGQTKESYDVRHILFSTMAKDPENPMGREMPLKDNIRAKLEEEKQEKFLEQIMANNHVTVAENFELPQISDAQIEEMMKKQMPQMPQMPSESDSDEPKPKDNKKPEPKKPEPKKK